jgi:hypothetical protein
MICFETCSVHDHLEGQGCTAVVYGSPVKGLHTLTSPSLDAFQAEKSPKSRHQKQAKRNLHLDDSSLFGSLAKSPTTCE